MPVMAPSDPSVTQRMLARLNQLERAVLELQRQIMALERERTR